MDIQAFFDDATSNLTYGVSDPETKRAVVIDSVLDYDPLTSAIDYKSADRVKAWLEAEGLELSMILETHAHADHLSGSAYLKAAYPAAQVGIGSRIKEVQGLFQGVFDLPAEFPTDGSQFDHLFEDGEVVDLGGLSFEVMFTPGHTPACVSYRFGDAVFTGDVVLMPDMGTGRCDFPAGSAVDLYNSVKNKLYTLPAKTRLFVGHDYQPGGRGLAYETTVGAQKADNIQLPEGRTEAEFVAFRTRRDASLATPTLLFQSIQVNVNAGELPAKAGNNLRYLKIPIGALGGGGGDP